jgi:hypothetical protein
MVNVVNLGCLFAELADFLQMMLTENMLGFAL